MGRLMTIADLIEAAIEAENAARKIYLGFSHKFLSHPEASDFWQTMADDEADHARILTDLRDMLEPDTLSVPIDAQLAEKALDLCNLDPIRKVNSITNLDDAYRIAYELESSEVNTIFNFLMIRCLSHERSCKIISSTMDTHLLRLAHFSRQFGSANQCRHIAASA